jgi:hypothetical protein
MTDPTPSALADGQRPGCTAPAKPGLSLRAQSWWLLIIIAAAIVCGWRILSKTDSTFVVTGSSFGSGPAITQDRPLAGPIHGVTANAIHLRIVHGDRAGLQITAPADCQQRIETQVQGDHLSINLLSGLYPDDMVVTIITPGISTLRLSDSSTADIAGLDGEACVVDLADSSHAMVSGSAGSVQVRLSGSSKADLAKVAAGHWDIICTDESTCIIAGKAQAATMTASDESTIEARTLQCDVVQATASGESSIHLGRAASLQQTSSDDSSISTESP